MRESAPVKEYDLFVPLNYNDGRQVEPKKFQDLQKQLLDHFGGLTFVPQPNEDFCNLRTPYLFLMSYC